MWDNLLRRLPYRNPCCHCRYPWPAGSPGARGPAGAKGPAGNAGLKGLHTRRRGVVVVMSDTLVIMWVLLGLAFSWELAHLQGKAHNV